MVGGRVQAPAQVVRGLFVAAVAESLSDQVRRPPRLQCGCAEVMVMAIGLGGCMEASHIVEGAGGGVLCEVDCRLEAPVRTIFIVTASAQPETWTRTCLSSA